MPDSKEAWFGGNRFDEPWFGGQRGKGDLRRAGEIFFVTPTDQPEGSTFPEVDATDSFDNLQDAIDSCVDDRGDQIYVAHGNHDLETAVEFNKEAITVYAAELGLPAMVQGEKFFVNAAASLTSGPAAIITKPCRIVGLSFGARDLTAENLLIDAQGAGGFSGGFVSLEYCRFPAAYGAIDAGIRTIAGALNHVYRSTFDGLFVGYGTAGVVMENDGAFAPFYPRVLESIFSGVGTGKHAIVHAVGSVPVSVLYKENVLDAGALGNLGKFLDNNSVAASGILAGNWLGGLTNAADAFENTGGSTLKFAGNRYDE